MTAVVVFFALFFAGFGWICHEVDKAERRSLNGGGK